LQFLPDVERQVLHDRAHLQLYRIEDYLKEIVIPVPPYRTSFNFLLLVTKGCIKQQLEADDYLICAGQALNIKQGCITRTHEISDDIEGFYLIYENEVITSLSLNKQDFIFFHSVPFASLHLTTLRWLVKACELLKEELQKEDVLEEICLSLFRTILLKITAQVPSEKLAITRELEIAYTFREYLQQYHIEHKDVMFYARKMAISETYLNKCVKKTTGKPPKQWINEVCILHSQILLRDLGCEIADVAYKLNFQSLSHFSRMFKKVTGKCPSAYKLKANK
jgi:AraC-like DNA-binding protein